MNVKKIESCPCKSFSTSYEFQHEARRIISFSDHKSKTVYRYINHRLDYVAKYHVDGDLIITNDEKKCDYLLINCNKQQAVFIEIKGCDLEQATKQILHSINILYSSLPQMTIHARIVLTRVNTNDLRTISYLRLKKRIESLNGTLIKKSSLIEDVND